MIAKKKAVVTYIPFDEEDTTASQVEKFIIETENIHLSNPFSGALSKIYVLITDNHKLHIKKHLKYLYNPATWVHIWHHFSGQRQKEKMGIGFLNNDNIMSAAQYAIMEKIMMEPPNTGTTWN
jgi:hypothetical protein